MKTIVTLILLCFLWTSGIAQTPQAFKYQAVARDLSGNVLAGKPVSFKISILSGSATGTVMYSETHAGKITNGYGLVDLEVGKGTVVNGTFSSIPWSSGTYFIKIEMDPAGGIAYQAMGTSQLLSVPYALHAKTAETGDNWGTGVVHTDGTLSGTGTMAAPLMVADNGISSAKILNSSIVTADLADQSVTTQKLQDLSVSSIKIQTGAVFSGNLANSAVLADKIATDAVTGPKIANKAVTGDKIAQAGAVAGQALRWNGSTWAPGNDNSAGLILPYKDSTTVADKETVFKLTCIGNTWSSAITGVSKSANGTGVVGEGPFGVVGYATAAGGTGVRGVNASTTGSGFGLSGVANSPEAGGVWGSGGLYGVKADAGSSSGYGIYGTASSASGITYGIYGRVTSSAGYAGYFKGGKFHVSGRVGIGTESPSAGLHLKGSGFPESFMYLESNTGQDAGFRLYEGATDKWHIFNNVGAGGLQIYNNAGQTAFFAKQSNSYVGIGTTTPNYTLEVIGTAGKTGGGSWSTSSDIRLKNVTGDYPKGLNEICALQPVVFTYKTGNSRHLPADVPQIGFVAQDVQKVFPEAVAEGEDGFLDFNMHAVNVALVNAVRELKSENDRLRTQNELLKAKDDQLSVRIERLEKLVGASAQK